jgi:hypothetical protein
MSNFKGTLTQLYYRFPSIDTPPILSSRSSTNLNVHILGLQEVGHVLGLGVWVLGVVVVIRVGVVCGANVVHLVDGAALHAARLGLLAGEGDPEDAVRVGGVAGATDVLLVAGSVDGDGFIHRACVLSVSCH